jgi:hypothetical protein
MNRISFKTLLLLAMTLVWLQSVHASKPDKYRSAFERIQQSYAANELGLEERIMQTAYALFEPGKLDKRFYNDQDVHPKCGTGFVMDIKKNLPAVSAHNLAILELYLSRPSLQYTYSTPEGHFKLHYNTSGTHQVYQASVDVNPEDGHPDFVNRMGNYFETARHFLIDSLKYDSLPPDDGAGGDDLYDVYIYLDSPQALGITYGESKSSAYPGREAWSSYITIRPKFPGVNTNQDDQAKVVSAHEFFHAVQLAYNAMENGWWFCEVSSMWIEEILWDNINDYYVWLPSFFSEPYKSLTTFNGAHEYGSIVWGLFLSEKFGIDVIRQIWTEGITGTLLDATDNVLKTYGSSLAESFTEFTLWNLLTSYRTPVVEPHYEEAKNFPSITFQAQHSSYPVDERTVQSEFLPEPLAANYISFKPDQAASQKLIMLNAEPPHQWQLYAVGFTDNQFDYLEPQEVAPNQFRTVLPQDDDQLVLVPVLTSTSGPTGSYNYSVLTFDSERLFVDLQETIVVDRNGADDNERIEAGETGQLSFAFKNYGGSLENVDVTLRCAHPQVQLIDSTIRFSYVDDLALLTNTDSPFTFYVSPATEPQRIPYTLVVSDGEGADYFPTSFLLGFPPLLLVNDDLDETSRLFYQQTFDELSLLYDSIDPSQQGYNLLKLQDRHTVVWVAENDNALKKIAKDSLENFLSRKANNLLLIGPNLGKNLADSAFFHSRLHAGFAGESNGDLLIGEKGDYISQSQLIGFNTRGVSKQILLPLDGAEPVFQYVKSENAGAIKFEGDNKIVFYSFALSDLTVNHPNLMSPSDILLRTLDWLNGPTSVPVQIDTTPTGFRLHQNYPNPFNLGTTISFEVPSTAHVALKIFNLNGQLIRTLVDKNMTAGFHAVSWDGKTDSGQEVSSGAYVLFMASPQFSDFKKLLLLK